MSRGHSWKSFKVPEPESRLLHILKWMARWQDQTSSDSVLHAFTPRYFQMQDKEPEQTVFLSCGVPF